MSIFWPRGPIINRSINGTPLSMGVSMARRMIKTGEQDYMCHALMRAFRCGIDDIPTEFVEYKPMIARVNKSLTWYSGPRPKRRVKRIKVLTHLLKRIV